MDVEIDVVRSGGASDVATMSPINWDLELTRLVDKARQVTPDEGGIAIPVRPLQVSIPVAARALDRTREPMGEKTA